MQLRFYLNAETTPRSAERLGIASATLSLLSLAADQLRLSTTRSLGKAPLEYGDTIRLVRVSNNAESTLFIGRVTSIRAAADATQHAHDITLLGPWADLEQIVYKQQATLYDAASGEKISDYASRVILSGGGRTVAQMLQDVVSYAADKGGAALASTPVIDNIAMALPRDEQEGLTCAGAIQRLLRFMPDATSRFDYAPATPVLHLSRANERDVTSLADRQAAAIDLAALTDRAIDRVEIEVYKTNTIDGKERLSIERLRYPTDPDAWADGSVTRKTLSVPLEMEGRAVAYERARIESEKLPDNLIGTPQSAAKLWLQNHIEELSQNIFDWPEGVTVAYETRRFMYVDDAGEAVYETKTDAEALAQFPRIAHSAIPHWVDTTAQATLTVTFPKKAEERDIGGTKYAIGSTENEVYTLRFTACSAESGNYRRIASAQAAEICPATLPQELWNSWHPVYAEGTLTLWLGEADAIPTIGSRVTGYPGEVEGSLSIIQGITLSDSGELSLTLGPHEHLAPHDLVELLRGFRTRRPARHANQQETGEDDAALDTGSASAQTTSARSSALQTKSIIYGAKDKSKTATSGSGSSATPAKLSLTLPIFNPTVQTDPAPLTLEADASAFIGPQGPQGPTGPQGPQGPTGPQGPQGPTDTFNTGSALSLDVVTAVKYDTSTHKLTYTKQTIKFYGTSTGTASTVDITTGTAPTSSDTYAYLRLPAAAGSVSPGSSTKVKLYRESSGNMTLVLTASPFSLDTFGGWTKNGTVVDPYSNPAIFIANEAATYSCLIGQASTPTTSSGKLLYGKDGKLLYANTLKAASSHTIALSADFEESGHIITCSITKPGDAQETATTEIPTAFSREKRSPFPPPVQPPANSSSPTKPPPSHPDPSPPKNASSKSSSTATTPSTNTPSPSKSTAPPASHPPSSAPSRAPSKSHRLATVCSCSPSNLSPRWRPLCQKYTPSAAPLQTSLQLIQKALFSKTLQLVSPPLAKYTAPSNHPPRGHRQPGADRWSTRGGSRVNLGRVGGQPGAGRGATWGGSGVNPGRVEGQPGADRGSTRGGSVVNPGRIGGQPGADRWSTRGGSGVNPGRVGGRGAVSC